MPDLMEIQAQLPAARHEAQAPDVIASSGPVEVKEEERSEAPAEAPTQEVMVAQAEIDHAQSVTVYTICAK